MSLFTFTFHNTLNLMFQTSQRKRVTLKNNSDLKTIPWIFYRSRIKVFLFFFSKSWQFSGCNVLTREWIFEFFINSWNFKKTFCYLFFFRGPGMRLAREGGFGERVPTCLEQGELSYKVERLSIFHYGSSTITRDLTSSPDRSQARAFVICTDWQELKLLPFDCYLHCYLGFKQGGQQLIVIRHQESAVACLWLCLNFFGF